MNANGTAQTHELKRMSVNGNRLPPGPKGLPLVGVSFNLLQDPLELMRRVTREYGDIVRIPVILQSRILLNHPDYIQQLLLFQQGKFHKSTLTKETTERLLGQGLLISEGDFWRRQRFTATESTNTRPQCWSARRRRRGTGATAKFATWPKK